MTNRQAVTSPTVRGRSPGGSTAFFVGAVVVGLALLLAGVRLSSAGASRIDAQAVTDGVRLEVRGPEARMAAGDGLLLDITIENASKVPVTLASWECGAPVSLDSRVAFPTSAGTDAGDALDQAFRSAAAPRDGEMLVVARPPECALDTMSQVSSDRVIRPGESVGAVMTWEAAYVPGAPIPAGEIRVDVRAAIQLDADSAWQALVAPISVTVDNGGLPPTISAGTAIDAVIADKDFQAWLDQAPESTWVAASAFLQNLGPESNGIVPNGPSWEVDLFRVVDGERQWAISFVDVATGKVRSVNTCTKACGTEE